MARAGFFLLLMKRVFFCGVLPSKYSGRWRGWPHFDLAREKRNFYPVASLLCFGAPPTPLPLFSCSNGTGTEAGGQSRHGGTPQPPPFLPADCLPASGGGFAPKTFLRTDGGTEKKDNIAVKALAPPSRARAFGFLLPFCFTFIIYFGTIRLWEAMGFIYKYTTI